jgi:hypothetical protein
MSSFAARRRQVERPSVVTRRASRTRRGRGGWIRRDRRWALAAPRRLAREDHRDRIVFGVVLVRRLGWLLGLGTGSGLVLPLQQLLGHAPCGEHAARAHQAVAITLGERLDVLVVHASAVRELEQLTRHTTAVDVAGNEPALPGPVLEGLERRGYRHPLRPWRQVAMNDEGRSNRTLALSTTDPSEYQPRHRTGKSRSSGRPDGPASETR